VWALGADKEIDDYPNNISAPGVDKNIWTLGKRNIIQEGLCGRTMMRFIHRYIGLIVWNWVPHGTYNSLYEKYTPDDHQRV